MQEGGCRTSTSPAAPPLPPPSLSCCAADISRCSYSSKSWSCSNYVMVSAHQWQVPRVRRTFSMSPVSKSSSPPSKSNKFWRPAPCSSSDRLSRSSSESSVWLTCIAESATGLGECPLSRMHGAAYLEVPTTTPAHVANAARARNDAHRRGDPHRDGHGQQIYTRTHPSREVSHEGGTRTSAMPMFRTPRSACVDGQNIKSSDSQKTAKIVRAHRPKSERHQLGARGARMEFGGYSAAAWPERVTRHRRVHKPTISCVDVVRDLLLSLGQVPLPAVCARLEWQTWYGYVLTWLCARRHTHTQLLHTRCSRVLCGHTVG